MNNLQKQLQLKHLGYYLGELDRLFGPQINIFEIVGISLIFPVVGYLLTGIICSRGANFINDLFSKLKI